MKANIFMLAMALLIGALITYAFHAMGGTPLQVAAGGGLCTLSLMATLGVSLPGYPRSTLMFRTLASVLFGMLLIANLLFVWLAAGTTVPVIVNGLLATGGAIGLRQIHQSKQ